ncbi:hypothetical protein BU16DRAFT_564176 [Lophium mytilinum]|uniref:Uncharacterized protein n=1 Tax=Lophium mytilinum TaxID=390894 RepID=A0A6A6QL79_9PEZI|nr:hypothetical protein BU16DRAFT_564176 [Lophium mytilinum]
MTAYVSYGSALQAMFVAAEDLDTTGIYFLADPEHTLWLVDWLILFLNIYIFLHAATYLFCRFAAIVPAKRDRFCAKMDQFLASFAAFIIIKGHIVGYFSALPFLNRHVVAPLVAASSVIFGAFVAALRVLLGALVTTPSILFAAFNATLPALYEEFTTNLSAFRSDILTTLRVLLWVKRNADTALFLLIFAIIAALVVATLAHAARTDPVLARPKIPCFACNRKIHPSARRFFVLGSDRIETACSHACVVEVAFTREMHYASCYPDVEVNFRVCVARGVVDGAEKWKKLEETERAWVEKGKMSLEKWEKNRRLRAHLRAELAVKGELRVLWVLGGVLGVLGVAAACLVLLVVYNNSASIMSTIPTPRPSAEANLQEVADLMDEIYTTLAKMRYMPASAIKRAPHTNPGINLTLAAEYSLDPLVIRLHQLLPYVDKTAVESPDFIHGGEFADFRAEDDVRQSRDPLYSGWESNGGKGDWDGEDGEYIRPWVTPLSLLGNHQSVIIYDARKHRIWIIDQESGESTDWALRDVEAGEPVSANRMNYDHVPSRPAGDFLRDVVARYVSLEEIPGGGEHSSGFWEEEALRALYRKCGWPGSFDSDAFEVGMVRLEARNRCKYSSEQPLQEVETLKSWGKYADLRIERLRHDLSLAETDDQRDSIEFALWKEDYNDQRRIRNLQKAELKAERLCPGGVCLTDEDLPLWELRELESVLESQHSSISGTRSWIASKDTTAEQKEGFRKDLKIQEAKLIFLDTAVQSSRNEVDRLCAERGCTPLPRHGEREREQESVARSNEFLVQEKEHLALIKQRMRELRPNAVTVKKEMEEELEMVKKAIESSEARRLQSEKYYADKGDPL